MKKILFVFILSILITPFVYGGYEYTQRVTIQDYEDNFNNFVVEMGEYDDKWLVHHTGTCGQLYEGREIVLIIGGTPDGNNDRLRNGLYYECPIDQLEQIDGTLLVSEYKWADNEAIVEDEQGNEYRIYFSTDCHAMKGLHGYKVYLRQFGFNLNAGDIIYLPENGEHCAITYAARRDMPLEEVPEPVRDIKKPTVPTNVRAYPGKTGAYLFWDAAKDDTYIAQYIISVSPYKILDTKEWDLNDMPHKIYTNSDKTSYKIEDLQPDDTYFFYVIAVDAFGNISPEWSLPDDAYVRSSIAEVSLVASSLIIRQSQETDYSFLFRWNEIPGAEHYTVVLTVDGRRDFVSSNWQKDYIRILKKEERKGKNLKLLVRGYNSYGQRIEDEIRFSF